MRIGIDHQDSLTLVSERTRKADSIDSLLTTDDSTATLLLYSCETSSDGHITNGNDDEADTVRLYMTDKLVKERIGILYFILVCCL